MNTSFLALRTSIIAGLLCLCGCAVGPDYKAPKMPVQVQAFNTEPSPDLSARGPWWQRTDTGLRSLVEQALRENRDLRVAESSLREARALRTDAKYSFLPAGSVSAGYSHQLSSALQYPGMTHEERKTNVFELGVDSAWELDLFGRLRRAVEANSALTDAAEASLTQVRLLVAAEVARNYVELAVVQAAIPLQKEILSSCAESVRLAGLLVTEGKAARDKLAPAEIDLASAKNALNDLLLSERMLRNRLGVLTGGTALPQAFVATFPNLPLPVLSGDPVRILNERPDVQSSERRLAAATAAIGVTRADYFPRLSLGASVGAQAEKLRQLDTADAGLYSLGPRLQWDLLNLHRTKMRVRAAEARCEQALGAWENSVLLALEEVDNAQTNLESCREQLVNKNRALASMNASLLLASLRHQEGMLDPASYQATKRETLALSLEKLRAEGALANAVIFLQKSLATDR